RGRPRLAGTGLPPSGEWEGSGKVGGRSGKERDGVPDPGPVLARSLLLTLLIGAISTGVLAFSRSTFCSIIAQLTEETQPLFETTLKSRAVSEDCDAKFTCVVTGYPEPEVTWYRDDEELDRYCGLPKYEISQRGNRHTLQLYKCREEDAAIYQASARNAKGIVSCSGVLEVGTMTEYKIHQRWFAKLKRKAEAKLREIEQSRKRGKEAAPDAGDGAAPEDGAPRKLSPDRFQRKRRLRGAAEPDRLSGSGGDVERGSRGPDPVAESGEPGPVLCSQATGSTTATGAGSTPELPSHSPAGGREDGDSVDTDARRDGRIQANRRPQPDPTQGGTRAQVDKKSQVDTRKQADEKSLADVRSQEEVRTRVDEKPKVDPRTQEDTRTQVDEKPPVDLETQKDTRTQMGEKPSVDGRTQEDTRTQMGGKPPVDGRTQEDTRTRVDEKPPVDGRTQEDTKAQAYEADTSTQDRTPRSDVTQEEGRPQADERPQENPRAQPEGESFPDSQGRPPGFPSSGVPGSPQTPGRFPECPIPDSAPARPKMAETPAPNSSEGDSLDCPAGISVPPAHPFSAGQMDPAQSQLAEGRPPQPTPGVSLVAGGRELSLTGGVAAGGGAPSSDTHPSALGPESLKSEEGLGPGHPTPVDPASHQPPEARAQGGSALPQPQGPGSPAGEADSCLIDSLKNYLLLLLKLSSAGPPDSYQEGSQMGAKREGLQTPAPGPPAPKHSLCPTVEVAGLSPRTSRRILERVENNHLVQSAETLCLSPRTSRRLTGLLHQELQAGHQALALGRGPGRGSVHLTIPDIVVGEEEPGKSREQESPGAGESGEQKAPGAGERGELGESRLEAPGATPQELALGARRKRFLPRAKPAGEVEAEEKEKGSPSASPRGARKGPAPGPSPPPAAPGRSPTQTRKLATLEVPRAFEEPAGPGGDDDGPEGSRAPGVEAAPEGPERGQDAPEAEPRKAKDPFKAPQVIRKIRVEQFPDASGSLKLWCQFFNILGDSVLTWTKDSRPVAEVARSAGDEGPAALAIVQASPQDCGLYRCSIRNEHGADSTDFRLSPDVLAGLVSREEVEVGEEIEMTPMVFAKGLADSGCWGDKLFGRLVSGELRGGGAGGGLRKASRAKVIYGLEPVFESGRTCVIKVPSPLVFGPGSDSSLLGRNYDATIQGCKIQNMSREYCKIFAAEARAAPAFGQVPEIIPLYLIYRPANTIPYATLEEDLGAPLAPYCARASGSQEGPEGSEAALKCQTFQHWLYQWTNGGFLVTDLAGVGWKTTNVQIATRLRGYQGLKESCSPALLDQFESTHRCSPHCRMLGLQPLRGPESAHSLAKSRGPKSPSQGRRGQSTQSSPQLQKKGPASPQGSRKSGVSPKAARKASEAAGRPAPPDDRGAEAQGPR
uniref:non-specific serine/threonine protein kinase n=1 Tax=Ornithorhynchus anatinus TaxID=9258 RepID=A0A6I8N2Z3_ORNAN